MRYLISTRVMAGLGVLARLPGDVRKSIYGLRGVARTLAPLSRALDEECQYGLDHRRCVEPITGREVVSYLEQDSGLNITISAMRVCPRNEAEWNGDLIKWNVDRSKVREGGIAKMEVEYEDCKGIILWGGEKAKLVGMEGELVIERYLALYILEKRLRRETKRVQAVYASKQCQRLMRRALDIVLIPIGYTTSRFLGVPLLEGAFDIDPEVDKKLHSSGDLKITELADFETKIVIDVLARLKSVCDSYREITPRNKFSSIEHISLQLILTKTLVTNVKMNLCRLRHTLIPTSRQKGPVTSKELLKYLSNSEIGDVTFSILGSSKIYTVSPITYPPFPPDGDWRKRWVAEQTEKRLISLKVLEKMGDVEDAEVVEVVVDRTTGVEILGDDTIYSEVVRDQITRILAGTTMDIDTLLRSGDGGWDGGEELYAERNIEIRDHRMKDPQLRDGIETAFRSLYALLHVVYPYDRREDATTFGPLSDDIHDHTGYLAMTAFMQQDVLLPPNTRSSLRTLLLH